MEEGGSDVKKIAEQVSSNSEKLKKLDTIEEDVATLKVDMNSVKMLVQEHGKDIKGIKTDLSEVKSEVGTMQLGIKDLDRKTDRIEKKLDVVTIDHEDRLKKLEAVR